jgi:hypothetical protein
MEQYTITAYIGRSNSHILTFMRQGENDVIPVIVDEDVVTRAIFRFGAYCLDTNDIDSTGIFELEENAQKLRLHLGLISGITTGWYSGKLTVFDNVEEDGFAWAEILVRMVQWPVCPVTE